MKRISLLIAVVAMLALTASPAGAITDGELDGEDHPYVGLIVMFDAEGNPLGRCSGTLVSPTVFVTAGHCTDGSVSGNIWFETDVDAGIPANGYPFGGGTEYTAATYTHPLYVPEAFFLYDLGVAVLDEPLFLDSYAELPTAGFVDTIGNGRKNGTVTTVGYGLQAAKQNGAKADEKTQADRVRYQATPFIIPGKGVAGIGNLGKRFDLPVGPNSILLSGSKRGGGTCFGDSGGPTLVDETLIAVTSFGLNGNCAGVGGVFRIDRDIELGWISSFLEG